MASMGWRGTTQKEKEQGDTEKKKENAWCLSLAIQWCATKADPVNIKARDGVWTMRESSINNVITETFQMNGDAQDIIFRSVKNGATLVTDDSLAYGFEVGGCRGHGPFSLTT